MLNRIFLIGNLTRDPEVRYLPSGIAVTTFDIAVNERFRDRNQELREETLFIRVETFQRLAENCAQFLKKGRRVLVEGKLRADNWEGKDGVKRTSMKVRATNVLFLEHKGAEGVPAPSSAEGAVPQANHRSGAPPERLEEIARGTVTPPDSDTPYNDGVPVVDMNADPFKASPEGPETTDDLPF